MVYNAEFFILFYFFFVENYRRYLEVKKERCENF